MKGGAMAAVQKFGRSLMLPIAVLPIAGMLLRLGQPDLLDLPFVAAAGDAVFKNLGILFAVGVAVGLANENNGAAGLAAIVAYLVTTEGAKILIDVPPDAVAAATGRAAELLAADFKAQAISRLSVPAGLICGLMAGALYNRYANIRLPEYLAFFAGRRFVPIVSGFAALVVAAAFGFGWPLLQAGMDALSRAVLDAGEFGLFVYGVLNRVLIVTGLHHILNNIAWFLIGEYDGATGDLRRFFAGDPDAGVFMAGFFPVMMFGLPAACLAMYRSVAPGRRLAVGGLLLSMALTSFLTGITEPIEFSFMFVAPLLYAIHALLTGLSMVVMDVLDVRLGFGFSAGFFDYALNFNRAGRPWLLWPVGAVYALVYYALFRFAIRRFNLLTPGREAPDAAGSTRVAAVDDSDEIGRYIAALGGAGNLTEIGACTTRLRLAVRSRANVDEAALKRAGAAGVLWPSAGNLQVVVGLRADEIASGMRHATHISAEPEAPKAQADTDDVEETDVEPASLVTALGGRGNIVRVEAAGTRLLVELRDAGAADAGRAVDAGARGIAVIDAHRVQVLFRRCVTALADRLAAAAD